MPEPILGTWRPLLSGELASQALGAVVEIADDLYPFPKPGHRNRLESELSLAEGRTGAALFLAYLEQFLPGHGYGDRAVDLLNQAMVGLDGVTSRPELFHGFVGIAWAVEHFQGRLIDYDEDDPGCETALLLQKLLARPSWERLDLVNGLVGLGIYTLERSRRAEAAYSLRLACDQISASAQRKDGTATWWTPPIRLANQLEPEFPEGHFNLGMAHGIPAIIAFLAEACVAGQDTASLLKEAVKWLLDQRLPPGATSTFPAYITPNGESAPSRLGWCYGDTGIAVALLKAAHSVGETTWEHQAWSIARDAASRRTETSEGIMDASVCHGAAGLAHLFNRLYQASVDPRFAAESTFWIERTLAMRRPGSGIGGFSVLNIDERQELGWRTEPGFLLGAAGIGLVLLAAATPIDPEWDRLLMVSLPCPPQRIDSP